MGWSVGCKEGVACKWPWATVRPWLQAVEGTVRPSVVSRVVGSGWRTVAGKVAVPGELWVCYLYSIVSLG